MTMTETTEDNNPLFKTDPPRQVGNAVLNCDLFMTIATLVNKVRKVLLQLFIFK